MEEREMARVGVTAAAVIGGLCGAGGLHLVQAQGSAPADLVGETEITDPAAFREYAQKFPATLVAHRLPAGSSSFGIRASRPQRTSGTTRHIGR